MIGNSGRQTPFPAVLRRRAGRPRQAAPLLPEDEEGRDGIGEVDEAFDVVDIDDIVRAVLGGRGPAAETDPFQD